MVIIKEQENENRKKETKEECSMGGAQKEQRSKK